MHRKTGQVALMALLLGSASAMPVQAKTAGSPVVQQVTYEKKAWSKGIVLFVVADSLSFRASKDLSNEAVTGKLTKGDQVQLLDVLGGSGNSLVQVKIKKTNGDLEAGATGFVDGQHLSKEAQDLSSSGKPSKYFVIQNVATERTRVYERCMAKGCAHRLVMETDFLAGRAEPGVTNKKNSLTWLGRYKITGWKKFHQDDKGHYPSWYNQDYPQVPYNPSNSRIWFSKNMMPSEKGVSRGAFGWYTAMLAPNANSQWIQGSFGWGAETDKYLRLMRNEWVNVFNDPSIAGNTRHENRAVALMRELLENGTEVIRVYAREATRDSSLARYTLQAETQPWEWILTKEGVNANGPSSGRAGVQARQTPLTQILEYGTYQVDQFPDALPFSKNSGNIYELAPHEMKGVFFVDEGRLRGYAHPGSLPVGGFSEKSLPAAFVR